MNNLLLTSQQWSSNKAGLVYSFFSRLCLMLGEKENQEKYVQELYIYFYGNHQYYLYIPTEADGHLSVLYHLFQMKESFSEVEKKQISIWYSEFLQIEPMNEIAFFVIDLLIPINKIISTFWNGE